ncbi:MAG: hypothetical protein RLZZ584_1319 [Pseudomonadota bacterium]
MHPPSAGPVPRPIHLLAFDDFLLLDLTGPAQVYASANDERRDAGAPPAYRLHIVAPASGAPGDGDSGGYSGGEGAAGRLVASSSGLALQAAPLPEPASLAGGTLLVAGGPGVEAALARPDLGAWLQAVRPQLARLCSVCTGAFLLAGAGALDGRRATTHWLDAAELQRRFPQVQVQDDALHVRDGGVYTSAGISAGIDLALSLLEEDHGRAFALAVARRLVVYLERPGGQRQYSTALRAQADPGSLAERLHQWLATRLAQPHTVDDMAAAMALSPRSLHRLTLAQTGLTPAALLRRMRVEAACRLLDQPAPAIKQIALRSGFGDEYNLRRAFKAELGVTPGEYRQRFG